VDPPSRGSRLDADHPENGILIPCGFTGLTRYNQCWSSMQTVDIAQRLMRGGELHREARAAE
jgi:hypothetical protein